MKWRRGVVSREINETSLAIDLLLKLADGYMGCSLLFYLCMVDIFQENKTKQNLHCIQLMEKLSQTIRSGDLNTVFMAR